MEKRIHLVSHKKYFVISIYIMMLISRNFHKRQTEIVSFILVIVKLRDLHTVSCDLIFYVGHVGYIIIFREIEMHMSLFCVVKVPI